MKPIFICSLFFLASTVLFAQNKRKPVFVSYNAAGLTVGESAYSLVAETVNGFKRGNWFAGAGIAYDAYSYKTIPVYLDLKYYFGYKRT